ncbi:MAG: methylated-DNA--[protein]-cysteine S-methyltransferase [Anaerolineales bacterium]|nr:methylated-DNA--[protein]-cysteine S-methyltransferase [Anaerolineales bacterium]
MKYLPIRKPPNHPTNMLSISQIPTTPLGPVNVAWTANGVVAIEIGGDQETFAAQIGQRLGDVPTFVETGAPRTQVEEYLTGQRTMFDLDIDWALCTPFQRQVLEHQLAIPYGETRTYGQLAAQIGKPQAARAVGRAGATNPIPLIIPCHRVLGADGSLRGYGAPGGVQTKAWLLALENRT